MKFQCHGRFWERAHTLGSPRVAIARALVLTHFRKIYSIHTHTHECTVITQTAPARGKILITPRALYIGRCIYIYTFSRLKCASYVNITTFYILALRKTLFAHIVEYFRLFFSSLAENRKSIGRLPCTLAPWNNRLT